MSDVGGFLGLFLGLSMCGLFQALLSLVMEKQVEPETEHGAVSKKVVEDEKQGNELVPLQENQTKV